MQNNIHITVVIKATESNDLQQPHAVQVEKQVDSDQGSKLTRIGAYLPLAVGFIKLIDFIIDKLN
uniref:hypothetical protein n=1 Tax=Crenothrix polyspora TaxID=360316 RepID=UPI000B34B36C|nr:hypothetical protein [Crenothrix polyspora]